MPMTNYEYYIQDMKVLAVIVIFSFIAYGIGFVTGLYIKDEKKKR